MIDADRLILACLQSVGGSVQLDDLRDYLAREKYGALVLSDDELVDRLQALATQDLVGSSFSFRLTPVGADSLKPTVTLPAPTDESAGHEPDTAGPPRRVSRHRAGPQGLTAMTDNTRTVA